MKKFLCLLVLCTLFLCSCGKEEAKPVNANFGGTLKLYAFEDDTYNPLKTKFQTNAQIFASVMHRGLLKVLPTGEIECDLAESYKFSADKKEIVFKLKDEVFSDGSKITAENVINSLDMISEENMFGVVFDFVDNYSANGNSVTIKLKKADSGVLYYMNFPILKEENGTVIGAGAYKIPDGKSGSSTLVSVDSLKTNFSSVKILMCTKESMAENAFLNDEVDVIDANYSNLARLQGKTGINLTEYVSDEFTFLGINNQNEVLSDVNVRRALASLIDKKELTETLMAGYAKATNSPFKPGSVYGELYSGEYSDKTMFGKYLENAELSPGDLDIKILVNEESISKTKVAQYVEKVLEDAGVSASVESVDFDTYAQKINDGEYSLFVGETTVSLNQDFDFLTRMVGYSNPEMDKVLDAFKEETDLEIKKQKATDVAKMFVDELPVISLYYQKNTLLTDGDVIGDFAPMQTRIIGDITSLKAQK